MDTDLYLYDRNDMFEFACQRLHEYEEDEKYYIYVNFLMYTYDIVMSKYNLEWPIHGKQLITEEIQNIYNNFINKYGEMCDEEKS